MDGEAASTKGNDAPMMRSMFAAISGLKSHQVMMDVTANDIANVNTIGYKSSRTTFKDSLSQLQKGGSGQGTGQGGSNPAQVGLGTQMGSIDNVMGSGALQSTGNTLDVAVQGVAQSGQARAQQRDPVLLHLARPRRVGLDQVVDRRQRVSQDTRLDRGLHRRHARLADFAPLRFGLRCLGRLGGLDRGLTA